MEVFARLYLVSKRQEFSLKTMEFIQKSVRIKASSQHHVGDPQDGTIGSELTLYQVCNDSETANGR